MKNSKIKICLFFPYKGLLGGAEKRLISILKELSVTNDKYDIYILFHNIGDDKKSDAIPYENYTDENFHILVFKSAFKLCRFIIKNKINWVCYTDCRLRAYPVVAAAMLFKRKRMEINVHAAEFSDANGLMTNLTYKILALFSNRLDCLYPWGTEKLKKSFPKKAITTTPPILNTDKLYDKNVNKESVIVFSGRLMESKGALLFVKSICCIKEVLREKGYKCWVCGVGESYDEMISIINQENCDDLFEFKGYVKDMGNILNKAKIFCSLQQIGNYPSQAWLEAISCGCYSIVTPGPCEDIIAKKEFSEIVENDEIAISDAIKNAVQNFDEAKWQDIIISARQFTTEFLNIHRAVEHYDRIFSEQS